MNLRTHIKKLFVLAAGVLLAGAAVALADIRPNPVRFSGAGVKTVLITNTGPTSAVYRVSIDPAGAFTVASLGNCHAVPSHGRCQMRVRYTPSGQGQDRATLRAQAAGSPPEEAQLIGRSSSGGGGGGGGNGPNCTLHVARHQKLVKKAHGKTVRSPYQVAVLQDQDGTVSVHASGRTAGHKAISLDAVSSPATAGNGVVMKMKLPRSSENRIRTELKKGHPVKMTLNGTCTGPDGSSSQSAVIHFSDAKSGRGFTLPLEADARVR